MRQRSIRPGLGVILILASFLVQPVPVSSQCSVVNTVKVPATAGSPYTKVYKTLNGFYLCSLATSNNASLCAPGPQLLRNRLTASAAVGAMSPSCSFNCTGGCGSIVIDGSQGGLPVELMDFSIED